MNLTPNPDYENGYMAALKDVAKILLSAIEIREEAATPYGSDFCKTIWGCSTGPVDSLRAGV